MQNKIYRLLKDLPTFKAGEKFFISDSGNLIAGTPSNPKQITVETRYGLPMKIDLMAYASETLEEFPNILKDWFEELPGLNEYFYITDDGNVDFVVEENHNLSKRRRAIGNIFKTKEEAEKYLEYLKAKTIIKKDAKGFKPDWNNEDENRYRGCWNLKKDTTIWMYESGAFKEPLIFFKSVKDIKESFEKHPNEWRTYLTYEQ